ncbi:hypothetical protein RvY_04037 [Ramazzottius varieornatus]|uniref:PiggyBac transposable element-derived protein domain-containing protein n=1 Tax=Ramazzottius varieornatus TaxID=947166 RepID=A0A1D1UQ57_RAMVA|nr:hypothetical protein RvY_04037 [Ramazzottius varieornatus]
MTGQLGVTPSARSRVVTLMDTFNLFFTPQVKDLIIRFTNEEGKTQYGDGWVKLDPVVLDAYLGILLLQGTMNDGRCNIQLYIGKAPGGAAEKNQGQRVVLDLVEYLGNQSGRNVTTGNFFTSLTLGEALLKKNISLVGTMRKNRKDIPSVFLPSKSRAAFSSYVGHKPDFTLVSYVPKKGKAVVLLSSMHFSQ